MADKAAESTAENSGSADREQAGSPTFLQELFKRRVPQIMGIYLGASWGTVQFVDWLVNRYVWSPNLTEMTLVILLSLIPTTLILAWYHGKPGKDGWTLAEKFGIPANVAVTVALLFFIFSGKDLGAASVKTTLQDETGKTIERIVPKQEFRKAAMLYFFDNATGADSLNWLSYGVPFLLTLELTQDVFLDISNPFEFTPGAAAFAIYDQIRDAGYPDAVGLPVALMRKIARDQNAKQVIAGEIGRTKEGYTLRIDIYDAERGKKLATLQQRNPDIFALTDAASIDIRKALEIPAGHIEETPDLASSELLTASVPAFKATVAGLKSMAFDKDWASAQGHLERACELDPTHTVAHLYRSLVYLFTNQPEKRAAAYQPLMQHLYKLPERMQQYVKAGYYELKGQPDKQLAVVKMITKLYPEDVTGFSMLMLLHSIRGEVEEAIAASKRAYELDPSRIELLQSIAGLYENAGDIPSATEYYEKYARSAPKDVKGLQALGGLYARQGKFDKAREYYDQVLLLDPENLETMLQRADLEQNVGEFAEAEGIYVQALEAARSAEDSFKVYTAHSGYLRERARFRDALELQQRSEEAFSRYAAPLIAAIRRATALGAYVEAGKEDEAFEKAAVLRKTLKPPYDRWLDIGMMHIYAAQKNADSLEAAILRAEETIEAFKSGNLKPTVVAARATLYETRGETEQLIALLEGAIAERPGSWTLYRRLGAAYRDAGQARKGAGNR